ncbi:hypothetical protein Tco_0616429 [Tanacetum coccineum]
MPPKRTSTSEAPAITQDAIRKLVANSVTTALEAQAATMASASNPNRNTNPTGTPAVKWKYKKSSLLSALFTLMCRVTTNESLTTEELSTTTTTTTSATTTTTVTPTPTIATIIINYNKTEGKKLLELMLLLHLETIGGPFEQELAKQEAKPLEVINYQ